MVSPSSGSGRKEPWLLRSVKKPSTTNRVLGAIAAAATPLRAGGGELDEASFGPLLAFLAEGGIDNLQSALRVLTTLREGFRAIRDEAVELEKTGKIPAADELVMLAAEA